MTEGTGTDGQSAGTNGLLAFSDGLAAAVERAGLSTVRVIARRRLAATGIVWSVDGLVVTADHVVEVDEGITVGLPDGRTVKAALVGRDPGSDLAVLRAEATDLTPAAQAPKDSARVGSLALAVGRPGESGPLATLGIVSARTGAWRTWRGGVLESLIETDVVLYPGYSGGPLVDVLGRVAGLNSSMLIRGASAAVPVEVIDRVVRALLAGGKVRRGYLGVTTQQVAVPSGPAKAHGLTQATGLLVIGVEAGGPAEQGGLIVGDILIGLAGQPVRDADDLQALLTGEKIGASTPVRVLRGGNPTDVGVVVGERE